MMDWPVIDIRGILGDSKRCGECKERGDEVVLEASQTYSAVLCGYVDSWECPVCGHTVVRGDDPGVVNADGEWL